jgi:hypothetical protein
VAEFSINAEGFVRMKSLATVAFRRGLILLRGACENGLEARGREIHLAGDPHGNLL